MYGNVKCIAVLLNMMPSSFVVIKFSPSLGNEVFKVNHFVSLLLGIQ